LFEEIDISKLNAGIYFLKLAIGDALYQFKVIKTY